MKNKFVIVTPIRVPVGFNSEKLTKRSKQQDFCDANYGVLESLKGERDMYKCYNINCGECMFNHANEKFFKEWKSEMFKGFRKTLQKIKGKENV